MRAASKHMFLTGRIRIACAYLDTDLVIEMVALCFQDVTLRIVTADTRRFKHNILETFCKGVTYTIWDIQAVIEISVSKFTIMVRARVPHRP